MEQNNTDAQHIDKVPQEKLQNFNWEKTKTLARKFQSEQGRF